MDSKSKRKTRSPTLVEIRKYIKTHKGDEANIGSMRINNDMLKIRKLPNDKRERAIYNLLRKTKIEDPNTGKMYVRHGVKGKSIVRQSAIKTVRKKLNNPMLNNTAKATILNNAFKRYGVKNAMTHFGTTKVPILRTRNKDFVRSGRMYNADIIRQKLAEITDGEVTLASRTTTLGEGVSGLAVKCISNTKCRKDYKDLVLKISNADNEWKNEIKYLEKLTKYMKENPKKDPLAPKIYGHFKIGNRGFILMQNAKTVYPKAVWIGEWEKVASSNREKLKLLDPLKRAMDRLHKEVGIMHGNMHHGNVWFAQLPARKKGYFTWKAYFADFGRSANYNAVSKFRKATRYGKIRTWRYGSMMNDAIVLLKHPNINGDVMDDDKVLKQYYIRESRY